jgi:hypothetical protein
MSALKNRAFSLELLSTSMQKAYSIAFASLLVPALCAGCVSSVRANSPVSIAISRFLKVFILKA